MIFKRNTSYEGIRSINSISRMVKRKAKIRAKTYKEVPKAKDRIEVMEKIKKLEKEGRFDVDTENDPPTIPLEPNQVDYLKRSMMSKVNASLANAIGKQFLLNILRTDKLIIKDVKGIENLNSVNTGAVITCNHFNPFDCFTVESVFRMSKQYRKRKLYKVIREGNYTNFPGFYGFLFRNADTLPLSSNKKTMIEFMRAVNIILKRGDFILIYPEQSLWWNYRKPKPLKDGGFHIAVKANVPIIPIFITMEDSKIIGNDGFPVQEYIVNISKPIYPNENLPVKENISNMMEENYTDWKNIYEDFYKMPLEYSTDPKIAEENNDIKPDSARNIILGRKL